MHISALVLGISGNALSVLVLASPLPTFWRIMKMKSTESFSAIPYISTLFSNCLWLYYGVLKPDHTVLVISVLGLVFGVFYLSVYLLFAPKVQRVSVSRLLLLLLVCLATIFCSAIKFTHCRNVRIIIVGTFCAGSSACLYGSPLSVMRLVIKTKSVEYMPFGLSFFLGLSAAVWLAYALVIRDPFLMASNSIGSVFGILQLSLYAFYSRNKQVQYLHSADDATGKTICCPAVPHKEGLKPDLVVSV